MLAPAERDRSLAAAENAAPPVRLLCELLAATGCTLGEALQLRVSSIDLSGGTV